LFPAHTHDGALKTLRLPSNDFRGLLSLSFSLLTEVSSSVADNKLQCHSAKMSLNQDCSSTNSCRNSPFKTGFTVLTKYEIEKSALLYHAAPVVYQDID
jgi:hypothetical protein